MVVRLFSRSGGVAATAAQSNPRHRSNYNPELPRLAGNGRPGKFYVQSTPVGWTYGGLGDLLVPQLEFLVFLKIQGNFRISGNYPHIPV